MRDRLIELLKSKSCRENLCMGENCADCEYIAIFEGDGEKIADYILADGWIRPPCKVGQTVYVVDKRLNVWWQGEVDCVYCNKNSFEYGILFDNDEYGAYNEEDVFFTKEEAEQALKGDEGK